MSCMFEVFYKSPADASRESALTDQISRLGGRLTYREGHEDGAPSICLTFEFDDKSHAEQAAEILRRQGEHVEGPVDYGP